MTYLVCSICGVSLTDAEAEAVNADVDFVPHGDHLVRVEPEVAAMREP